MIRTSSTCLYSQKADQVKVNNVIYTISVFKYVIIAWIYLFFLFYSYSFVSAVFFHEDHDSHSEFHALDSARTSFSVALKECQKRRFRSDAVSKKIEHQQTVSLDLNNNQYYADLVSPSSPRLTEMKRNTVSPHKSENISNPGTPTYRGAFPGSNRRVTGGAALLPLNNNNVRALPSKWEDAERWICSPVGRVKASSYCHDRASRRPKSKSGPLGAPGVAYNSMYSPIKMYDGGGLNCHMVIGSPFSEGVIVADNLSVQASSRGSGRAFGGRDDPCIARSVSVHGCTDLVCQSHESLDGKIEEVSREVSGRDMATQMSPEGSGHSSPRRASFSPSTRSILPVVEVQSVGSTKSEVRDVQIDERVTVTLWSNKYMGRITGSKGSGDMDEWKTRGAEPRSSAWEVADTLKSVSKREEAKITAWENLQKAKAETAIRKLEMKLEKKRWSSMEKIMKKLKSSQKKAQEMRSSVLTNQAIQVSNANSKSVSFRRTRQMGSLSACFTGHAL